MEDSATTNSVTNNEAKVVVKEKYIMSTKDVPLYKIASKQRNMLIGTIIAGHKYPYKGKTHNTEGIFYSIGKGFVFAEACVKIQ